MKNPNKTLSRHTKHNTLITSNYDLTLQNLLFRIPKAAVLHGKSVGFALQKSRFHSVKPKLSFLFRTFFTKQEQFYAFAIDKGKKTKNTKLWCFSISCWC